MIAKSTSRFVIGLIVAATTIVVAATPSWADRDNGVTVSNTTPRCPWVRASRDHSMSPSALAGEVLAAMTLVDKARTVTLSDGHQVENFNEGVPALCIPPLTLSDGPNGLAGRVTGVTQLPAAIGIAASFNPALAWATGHVVGEEARTKGIDVVQGPDLNLARVPFDGRLFESFGEDPDLTGELGAANIDGLQSAGVMAMVKHFVAYTQETARARLDQLVTARALAELYNAPFEVAVKEAHVAAVMCSSGSLNGSRICADPYVYATLKSWGFRGFVRSDLRAALYPAKDFAAGLDLIKPGPARVLVALVRSGSLPLSALNRAVRTILTQMFTFGLIAHPRAATVARPAATPAHEATALEAAEESVVLLKDQNNVLPLAHDVRSLAVIGADASTQPLTTGNGSSRVTAPFVVTPLTGLRKALGAKVHVTYAPDGTGSLKLGRLSNSGVVNLRTLPLSKQQRLRSELGNDDLSIEAASNVTNAVITASQPSSTKGWSHWRGVLHVKHSGIYEIELKQIGDTWLYVNGRAVLSSPGLHNPVVMSTALRLKRGRRYTFEAKWFSVIRQHPPEFAIADVSASINRAVELARKAKVAIIFAGEASTEGADQTTLSLPGDENELIDAVTKVNAHTIVVLNTGGPVLMPWLAKVQAVLEAWYPGEEDGTAIAAILDGRVDPSGRLPVSFPTSNTAEPVSSPADFPGVNDEVNFGVGDAALDIGYRWYQANNVTPLFAFGFGLDYTTIQLSSPVVTTTATNIVVHATLTNTGTRSGDDVVQVYLRYPSAAGEPPEQLRAFARVGLISGASRRVTLDVPLSSLQVFLNGHFTTVSGTYGVAVGSSSADLSINVPVRVS